MYFKHNYDLVCVSGLVANGLFAWYQGDVLDGRCLFSAVQPYILFVSFVLFSHANLQYMHYRDFDIADGSMIKWLVFSMSMHAQY